MVKTLLFYCLIRPVSVYILAGAALLVARLCSTGGIGVCAKPKCLLFVRSPVYRGSVCAGHDAIRCNESAGRREWLCSFNRSSGCGSIPFADRWYCAAGRMGGREFVAEEIKTGGDAGSSSSGSDPTLAGPHHQGPGQ